MKATTEMVLTENLKALNLSICCVSFYRSSGRPGNRERLRGISPGLN